MLAEWWRTKRREAQEQLAMPEYRPALWITLLLFIGGFGLGGAFHSPLPLTLAWLLGVGLMVRYKVSWSNQLVHRDREPLRYWIGVAIQAAVAALLTVASVFKYAA